MKIAVVILNWNGRQLLEKFLPSVISNSPQAEIYVADNDSDDDSIAFLQQKYPTVKVIKNTVNGGFAKGYNDALKHVEAEIYCLLNSDVEVTPNWLVPIIEVYNTIPDTAIVQPKILDYKRKDHFEYAGAAGGFIDLFGYPFCRGRIFQTLEKDNGQYNDIREIFWASGACLFVKSDIFKELGGFDEDYFAHQEEIDFCWKAHNRDYKIIYTGHSHVYHVGGATLSTMNPRKTFLNFRNSLYSITKNLPKRKVCLLIFARLILDGVAALRFLFLLKLSHLTAIFMAHISFYLHFFKMFRKRCGVHTTEKYHSTTSVVWSYYVKKKQFYSDLVKD